MQFSTNEKDEDFRPLNDGEIISVLVLCGTAASGKIEKVLTELKPALCFYDGSSNQFIDLQSSKPVKPFNESYWLPGFAVFSSELLKQKIINQLERQKYESEQQKN